MRSFSAQKMTKMNAQNFQNTVENSICIMKVFPQPRLIKLSNSFREGYPYSHLGVLQIWSIKLRIFSVISAQSLMKMLKDPIHSA